jgi:hypothetical protein
MSKKKCCGKWKTKGKYCKKCPLVTDEKRKIKKDKKK